MTESKRLALLALGKLSSVALYVTTGGKRLFFGDQVISRGHHHGEVATEAAMLALHTTGPAAPGCWPGDTCMRADTGSEWRCIAGNGRTAGEWVEVSLSAGRARADDAAQGARSGLIEARATALESARHVHANQAVLDGLGVSAGALTFGGTAVSGAGGAGRGLFSDLLTPAAPILSAFTPVCRGAGATVVQAVQGIAVSNSANTGGENPTLLAIPAPASPYTLTVLVSLVGQGSDCAHLALRSSSTGKRLSFYKHMGSGYYVSAYSADAVCASDYTSGPALPGLVWLRLRDDGTTLTFSWSAYCDFWTPVYSVAKAASYLGSTGDQLVFGTSSKQGTGRAMLWSWSVSLG
jgi:hypothetical protein